MKQVKCYFLILFFVSFSAGMANAQDAAALLSIDISSQPGQANVEVRPGTPVVNGTAPALQILREIITTGSSVISATVTDEQTSRSSDFDLGIFEAQILLNVHEGNSYQAVVKMTVSKEGAEPRSTKISMTFDAGQNVEFKPENIDLLSERFTQITKALYQDKKSTYGQEFENTLAVFAEEYVRGIMDSAPKVIESMVQRDRNIREKELGPDMDDPDSAEGSRGVETAETSGAIPVGVNKTPMTKPNRENYYREETLSIRPEEFDRRIILVPEYLTLTSFTIPDPNALDENAVPLARVEYFVATVPTPYGTYQTTFILNTNYKMLGKSSYQHTMEHEKTIDEGIFFPRWRLKFLSPALKDIVQQGKTGADVNAREAFVEYFEPFMFDEYYDFSPILVKAQMIFNEKSTKDKIAKTLKRQAEDTQRKIKEMKDRQKALANPVG